MKSILLASVVMFFELQNGFSQISLAEAREIQNVPKCRLEYSNFDSLMSKVNYPQEALDLVIAAKMPYLVHVDKEGKIKEYELRTHPIPILTPLVEDSIFPYFHFNQKVHTDSVCRVRFKFDILYESNWHPHEYSKGLTLLRIGNYNKALEVFTGQGSKDEYFKYNSLIQAGICSYMLDDTTTANKYFSEFLMRKDRIIEYWGNILTIPREDLFETSLLFDPERKGLSLLITQNYRDKNFLALKRILGL